MTVEIDEFIRKREISVRQAELDEIMEFVADLVQRMNSHAVHYMVSSSFTDDIDEKAAYEKLRQDVKDTWQIWEMLRDMKNHKQETET